MVGDASLAISRKTRRACLASEELSIARDSRGLAVATPIAPDHSRTGLPPCGDNRVCSLEPDLDAPAFMPDDHVEATHRTRRLSNFQSRCG